MGKFSFELTDANRRIPFIVCGDGLILDYLCMIANAIFTRLLPHSAKRGGLLARRTFAALLLTTLFLGLTPTFADEVDDVERAVLKLTDASQKEGYDFRADIWQRELTPAVGKAVRVQFFKGNDYRVCVAVAPKSKVQVAAHVLDAQGKPMESKVEITEDAWGIILHVKPKNTGVYMVVIRHAGGSEQSTLCAMITGYK